MNVGWGIYISANHACVSGVDANTKLVGLQEKKKKNRYYQQTELLKVEYWFGRGSHIQRQKKCYIFRHPLYVKTQLMWKKTEAQQLRRSRRAREEHRMCYCQQDYHVVLLGWEEAEDVVSERTTDRMWKTDETQKRAGHRCSMKRLSKDYVKRGTQKIQNIWTKVN